MVKVGHKGNHKGTSLMMAVARQTMQKSPWPALPSTTLFTT